MPKSKCAAFQIKRENCTTTGSFEPELLAQFRAFLRARLDADHLVDGIADETEQRESDQRDHDHDKHGLNDAADDESEHV